MSVSVSESVIDSHADSHINSAASHTDSHNNSIWHEICKESDAYCDNEEEFESDAKEATESCDAVAYLNTHIFPILLPAMEEMLQTAKEERCFERHRTKFNALDFLTEYLYNHNLNRGEMDAVSLASIPFVAEWWLEHPRPPLRKSLLWTEEEATLIIQSHWRGYKVRINPEVQELRQWQREYREENANIQQKIEKFWSAASSKSQTEGLDKS